MKKWIIPIICAVSALFLILTCFSSHGGVQYTSIGKTYNKFMFFPAKSANFTISFRSPYTGSLTLIDDKGRPLSDDKYTIEVDGKKTGATFSVKEKRIVKVSIRCSKTVSPGKQYVQVKGGGPLVTHVYFTHHLNPLFVWISWVITILAVVALVWFLILRRAFYPQFKSCQKTFFIPNQAPLVVKLTGARLVVISSETKKQSFWDSLIKGPVLYKSHPAFSEPISMRPLRGGRIMVKANSSVYKIAPNPIPRIGSASIDDLRMNKHITIN